VEICGKRSPVGSGMGSRPSSAAALDCASVSPQALSACSACAGDYEDPDRTAWMPDVDDANEAEQFDELTVSRGGDIEHEHCARANRDEFPARET
jgi:hypothetical protein